LTSPHDPIISTRWRSPHANSNTDCDGTDAPYEKDYVALIALRGEQGVLNYLNLFISHQVRTGRYQELYKKWVGAGSPPDLTIPGVYE
jgi:polar amino acid transport system substrate-binding protein